MTYTAHAASISTEAMAHREALAAAVMLANATGRTAEVRTAGGVVVSHIPKSR